MCFCIPVVSGVPTEKTEKFFQQHCPNDPLQYRKMFVETFTCRFHNLTCAYLVNVAHYSTALFLSQYWLQVHNTDWLH